MPKAARPANPPSARRDSSAPRAKNRLPGGGADSGAGGPPSHAAVIALAELLADIAAAAHNAAPEPAPPADNDR